MSLYAEYLKERENITVFEFKKGFVSYRVQGKECYLREVFVLPKHRKSGVGKKLIQYVERKAKTAGCSYVYETACPETKNCRESMLFFLKSGYSPVKSNNELVYFAKELK